MNYQTILLATLVLGAASLGAADSGANAPQTPALKPIAPGDSGLRATSFAPLAYFNQNCARCHGENGSYYSQDMGKNKDDDALRHIIDEMAKGPGQAPLAPADLEVVTAWHRALRDKKPFVALVKAEKTGDKWQLSGEVSPGATLQIDGEAVEVEGINWTHQVSAQTAQTAKLRAQKGEAVTELELNSAAFAP